METAPDYASLMARYGLHTVSAVFDHFQVPRLPKAKYSIARPFTLKDDAGRPVTLFFKRYEYEAPAFKYFCRPSKAQCEFQTYAVFERLGIPCAERVAFGEDRDRFGRLRRAFMITRAVPDAMTLVEFFRQDALAPGTGSSRQLRREVLSRLATFIRIIHQDNFHHYDLVWRNILVSWQPPASPKLWWIDCPRGGYHRNPLFRFRRRLRDLASFDKSAARQCRRTERLRCLLDYLGETGLTPGSKTLIRQILDYRRRRWPDDWD